MAVNPKKRQQKLERRSAKLFGQLGGCGSVQVENRDMCSGAAKRPAGRFADTARSPCDECFLAV